MSIIAIVSGAMLSTNVNASFGTPACNGELSPVYTRSFTSTTLNASTANNKEWFYLYLVSNDTIDSLLVEKGSMAINITGDESISGVYRARFYSNATVLELQTVISLHDATFTIKGVSLSFTLHAEPPAPPEPPAPVSLTGWFMNNGLTVFFALVSILSASAFGLHVEARRKNVYVRKENTTKPVAIGKWIKETEVVLGGTRYWKHTFRRPEEGVKKYAIYYSHMCKDEMAAKGLFAEIAIYWWFAPWIRLKQMHLRSDQQFPELVESTTLAAKFIKVLFYLFSWVPGVNKALNAARRYEERLFDGKPVMVAEIPFLYLTYAEDQLFDVEEITWIEEAFNEKTRKHEKMTMTRKMTRDELILLKNKPGVEIVKEGERTHEIRRFTSLDNALDGMVAREDMLAKHYFEIGALDAHNKRLNDRLENLVKSNQKIEREQAERIEDFVVSMQKEQDVRGAGLATFAGRLLNYRDMGLGERDAIQQSVRDMIEKTAISKDDMYVKKMDEIKAAQKNLDEERELIRMEREKATRFDIHEKEVHRVDERREENR